MSVILSLVYRREYFKNKGVINMLNVVDRFRVMKIEVIMSFSKMQVFGDLKRIILVKWWIRS